ncbi:MAG: hypothetical protein ACFNUU_09840 [Campylobacter sp.]|uniref:hypothetical protein n=1 Tax=Campylobacter sp. TaxID=205 RepID=UPI00360ED055
MGAIGLGRLNLTLFGSAKFKFGFILLDLPAPQNLTPSGFKFTPSNLTFLASNAW